MDDKNFDDFIELVCRLIGSDQPRNILAQRKNTAEYWDKSKFIQQRLKEHPLSWDCAQFNEILKLYGGEPIAQWLFKELFGKNIADLKSFKDGVDKFQKTAALAFGNIKYAFRFFFRNSPSKRSESIRSR